ncbi:MAG: site-specific DNA-methyltransferase [Chloroflexi bacterium]|nr:site-specific DNA-methyltransferase [Chloroflexota bacterium]
MPTLTWLNDNEARKISAHISYRLLEADPSLSYGAVDTENMLIQGDNLEALKALLPYYAGQVKCIYIDPPYNTQSAFEHYDDNLEHSTWLSMMYARLELLRDLLAEDGSIWVSIDDNEGHYLKVLMDEVFGRNNFVANVLWQKRTSPDARIQLGAAHDHILVYAKSIASAKFRKLGLSELQTKNYKNPDNDPRGPWVSTDFSAQGWRPNQMYRLRTPGGSEYDPPPGRCWVNLESEYNRLSGEGRMWFGVDGKSRPRVKTYLYENNGISSWSWWTNTEVGHNQEAKKEINVLFGADSAFDTPKPERLLSRIIHISSSPGDLVLDSFLGSGTTAAVAHKMGRRYIGIEMGNHAVTHCVPRLQKVIEGEQGGISQEANWLGGGGFRFYRLGETVFDEYGQINPAVRFKELAAHVWFVETKTPFGNGNTGTPLLGIYNETAIYLLYNGILGDKRPEAGNVLTSRVLESLPAHPGPKVIYGETSFLDEAALREQNITFKHIPYDIKAR